MYQIDFNTPINIHFIGIGGISMSGLAEILIDRGFHVSGSDMKESDLTKHLVEIGAEIRYPQKASNIKDGIDLVVYTAAIHPDNPEFEEVVRRNIPMLTRAQLLGEIMRNYKKAINVSGTHGKTTTTSMLAEIFMEAELDPTVTIGGIMKDLGGNIRVGGSEIFLAEACEYTNSFLSFFPSIEIILNVEADHLDFFKDLDDVRHSFKMFTGRLPEDGLLVVNSDIRNYEYLTEGLGCDVLTFGSSKDSDYSANFISYDRFARPSFTVFEKGVEIGKVSLALTGQHNIYNSLSAIAVSRYLGIDFEVIKRALKKFTGTKRRFEKKGNLNGVEIIDDYAHHPQEIKVTIDAAKKYPHRKLWLVFQPHTYSRTLALMDDFAGALSEADEIILSDIYAAREKNTVGVSSGDLREHMLSQNTNVYYIKSFEEIRDFLLKNISKDDIVITMGAGDIYKVGELLLEEENAIKYQ